MAIGLSLLGCTCCNMFCLLTTSTHLSLYFEKKKFWPAWVSTQMSITARNGTIFPVEWNKERVNKWTTASAFAQSSVCWAGSNVEVSWSSVRCKGIGMKVDAAFMLTWTVETGLDLWYIVLSKLLNQLLMKMVPNLLQSIKWFGLTSLNWRVFLVLHCVIVMEIFLTGI